MARDSLASETSASTDSPPPSPPSRRTFEGVLRAIWESWATRSLAIGGVATVLDILTLLLCVHLGASNPVAAMIGVSVGATFTFFANRHFAFRDHHPEVAPQVLKFVGATAGAMMIHAALVHLLADRWHVPVVLAKVLADIAVFSVGQLLLLRYLVFPKKKDGATPETSPRR